MVYQVIKRTLGHIGIGDDNALESMEEGASPIIAQENDTLISPIHMNPYNFQSTKGIRPTTPPNASGSQRRQQEAETPTKVRIVESSSPLVMRVSGP